MIITLAEAKLYLDIATDSTGYDAFITTLLSVVSNDIVTLCNQEIESTQDTIEVSGNGTALLLIPKFPLISVDSLKERTTINTDYDDITAIASTLYRTIEDKLVKYIYYEYGYSKGYSNYQLVYTHGYATIPEDIKLVAKEILALYFKDSDVRGGTKGGHLGLSSITESSQGIAITTTFKNMWSEWEKRLDKYRRESV